MPLQEMSSGETINFPPGAFSLSGRPYFLDTVLGLRQCFLVSLAYQPRTSRR